MKKQLVLVILALFLLASCASPTAEPLPPSPIPDSSAPESTAPPADAPDDAAYPAPDTLPTSAPPAYPVPPTPEVQPTVIKLGPPPTPGTDTGVVIGQLTNQETGEPIAHHVVYLGERIFLTPAPDYLYGIHENSSPHMKTDGDGRFALGDVLPGRYVIFAWTPFNAAVVIDPSTGLELEIEVFAGQTLDIGSLEVNQP